MSYPLFCHCDVKLVGDGIWGMGNVANTGLVTFRVGR